MRGRRFACPVPIKLRVVKTNRPYVAFSVASEAGDCEKSSTRRDPQARRERKLGKKLLGAPIRNRPVYQAVVEKDDVATV